MRCVVLGLLVAIPSPCATEGPGPQTLRERYEALVREAQEDPRPQSYAGRFLGLAQEHIEDPVAFDALAWVARWCRSGSDAERAIDLLIRDYARSPRMAALCGALVYPHPSTEKLLRAVLETNPDRDVRGLACVALARKLEFESGNLRGLKQNPEGIKSAESSYSKAFLTSFLARDPDAMKMESDALFARAAEEFGINPTEVGDEAPGIEGEDVEGKSFKLSDYRGKVVLLTFSGNWCGPCRTMYPHERELVERLKDRPFALLSVTTDALRETLREAVESGEITWRCWWDGAKGGPIATRWGIESYPTIYVLDHEGVIRYKHESVPEDKELDEVINTSLVKVETGVRP
jgi:peroxiredoxin